MNYDGLAIHITGIVQGVGFRPFVYGLAVRYELKGWVKNTSAGVEIEVEGEPENLTAFRDALRTQTPPLARIHKFSIKEIPITGYSSFEIIHSDGRDEDFIPISPDVSICEDCLTELFTKGDQRYRYPFINCTNCGPRFTIIKGIPYDRPKTTMADFPLCGYCEGEYTDPLNRRFHAQPVACPDCGPTIWLERDGNGDGEYLHIAEGEKALQDVRKRITAGEIAAVRGLGGFHLVCDASNEKAVARLRERKLRVSKPFAVMMWSLAEIEKHCELNDTERHLLASRERPIVVVQHRKASNIAASTAPNQDTLGVMLPYTPLHYLLLEPADGFPDALVMTSGNLSEEPIATGNKEAKERLSRLADVFLLHDRDIYTRCDDTVIRAEPEAVKGGLYPLRRARGYAPNAVQMKWEMPPILAAGPELKNTFCLSRDHYAFVSHHIGDLENYETMQAYEQGIDHYEALFRIKPEVIAYDLHPNYLATRYAISRAEQENLPAFGVQHHHAHIAACMAEHDIPDDSPVLGFAFDGTGYGSDGAVWGGEVLLADYRGFRRLYHLDYVPLPGGDLAVKEPWRMALAWMKNANVPWDDDSLPIQAGKMKGGNHLSVAKHQIENKVNAPNTSSMGRLFDAAASIAGVRQSVNYEGQAAIEFESMYDCTETGAYSFGLGEGVIEGHLMIDALIKDVRNGEDKGVISARFHNGLVNMVLDTAKKARTDQGVSTVVLSGGVWQNSTLLRRSYKGLSKLGFKVLTHHQVPANDGGVSLGQLVIVYHQIR